MYCNNLENITMTGGIIESKMLGVRNYKGNMTFSGGEINTNESGIENAANGNITIDGTAEIIITDNYRENSAIRNSSDGNIIFKKGTIKGNGGGIL